VSVEDILGNAIASDVTEVPTDDVVETPEEEIEDVDPDADVDADDDPASENEDDAEDGEKFDKRTLPNDVKRLLKALREGTLDQFKTENPNFNVTRTIAGPQRRILSQRSRKQDFPGHGSRNSG